MGDDEIVEEFERLHKSASRSKTARLRDLYDHIETLRSRGFTHATIIEAMRKHGLEFDLKTFEVTFYRIKKERAKRQARAAESTPKVVAAATPEITATNTATSPVLAAMERNDVENTDGLSIVEAQMKHRIRDYPKRQSK